MPTAPGFPMLVNGRLRRGPAGVATGADVIDAVAAARGALPGWSGTGEDERGRVLFGVAALLDQLDEPDGDRADADRADADGADADRWLWYAGWADKLAGLLGAARADAGSTTWAVPRPVGVVGAVAGPELLGLVDALAPALVVGATAVVLAPPEQAGAAGALAEVLAVAELPAGAANVLTGDVALLGPALARAGVDGFDPGDTSIEPVAGVRVLRAGTGDAGVARLRAWTTTTTVWHPAGR